MATRPTLTAIFQLAPSSFEGAVYRVVLESLCDKILSTEGNRLYPGRYHLAGETGIFYTALTETVAIQEITRHADRNVLRHGLLAGKIRIRLHKVLNLTQTKVLQSLGLSKDDLISKDYSVTQAISIQARKAGFQGLIVPSSASQGDNLIVFENNLGEGDLIEVEKITPV